MLSKLRTRMSGEGGFTLIELLVVIIIIAILAAIAIPTFLGQREKAQDTSARSLIRNAMTSAESAYVDVRSFQKVVTAADTDDTTVHLLDIEPSITWVADAGGSLSAAVEGYSADAGANEVEYVGTGEDTYTVFTVSETGTVFGATVNKNPDFENSEEVVVYTGSGW